MQGGERFGLDLEIELSGKADGAKETEMILIEARGRGANGADKFAREVLFAADPIVQRLADGIEVEAVDGEIAALGISLGIAEADAFGVAAILVVGFGAESGDLKLVARFEDDHDAEFAADGNGAAEEGFDLFGESGSDDVVIARFATEQEIPDTATDPKGSKAGVLEAPDDGGCGFAQRGVTW